MQCFFSARCCTNVCKHFASLVVNYEVSCLILSWPLGHVQEELSSHMRRDLNPQTARSVSQQTITNQRNPTNFNEIQLTVTELGYELQCILRDFWRVFETRQVDPEGSTKFSMRKLPLKPLKPFAWCSRGMKDQLKTRIRALQVAFVSLVFFSFFLRSEWQLSS